MRYFQTIIFAVVFSIAIGGIAQAQQPSTPGPGAAPEVTSLKVQVVLSRYQGDKKISSFPYTFSVTADGHRMAELRMGSQIPVRVMVQGTPTTSFKDVGTTITCQANSAGGDRFRLDLTVSDSSVYEDPAKPAAPDAIQTLRSFSSSNTLILRDGQSSQFTTATDRITGEVTKADVTLTVIK
ncbi:MAG TPA: hypothetical protein VGZ27_11810 [Vicinamibacterales bacterium]|jgi:hypothetical protein|nr:hypothetical protein [Vicinamibacterales bacterium]